MPPLPEQAELPRVDVGDDVANRPARTQEFAEPRQDAPYVGQMFDDKVEGNGVEPTSVPRGEFPKVREDRNAHDVFEPSRVGRVGLESDR